SGEIGFFEKACGAEQNRFGIGKCSAQSLERDSLGNKRERKFVLFVTERGRDFLEECFVRAMIVDLRSKPRRFFLETKLRGGLEHAAHALFRQISQRRLTTPGVREWNIRAERFRQSRGIDLDLRHVPVRFRAREKFAIALVDEDVK